MLAFTAAPAWSLGSAGLAGVRSNADEGGNDLRGHLSKLGKVGEQSCGEDRADPGDLAIAHQAGGRFGLTSDAIAANSSAVRRICAPASPKRFSRS
jgi:hypothetical protein